MIITIVLFLMNVIGFFSSIWTFIIPSIKNKENRSMLIIGIPITLGYAGLATLVALSYKI